MENPLIIGLIIIASIVFKIYEKYKEEQENARKRLIKLKKQQEIVIQEKVNSPVKHQKSSPVLVKEHISIESKVPENINIENKNQPEEVLRLQQKRLEKQKIKGLQRNLNDEHQIGFEKQISFDLRSAVIQQAILNRSYKD